MNKKIVYFKVIATLFFLVAITLQAQQTGETENDLYQEYMTLNQQLQTTQSAALEDPEIAKLSDEFYSLLDDKMCEIDPAAEDLIQQREEIVEDYENAQENNDQEKLQKLQQDYQKVNSEIENVQQQALQDEKIQQKQQKMETSVIEKMIEIEPKTEERIDRLQEVQRQLQEQSSQKK